MSLTRIFRTISLRICGFPKSKTTLGGTSGNLGDRPNLAPRWNQVRGAASEPYYTPANINSPGDGKTENFVA